MEQEIYDLAVTFLTEPIETEALEAYCRAAILQLSCCLRKDISPEDCADAFVPGAAWLALNFYLQTAQADGVSSFSAGDLSITKDNKAFHSLHSQALRLMAPFLKGELGFLGVAT